MLRARTPTVAALLVALLGSGGCTAMACNAILSLTEQDDKPQVRGAPPPAEPTAPASNTTRRP